MTTTTDAPTMTTKSRVVLPSYQSDDPEAQRIAREIDALGLPDYVREIRMELNNDWMGEAGIFLYVIIEDSAYEGKPRLRDINGPIDDIITELIHRKGGGKFLYPSFRPVSEQAWVDAEESKDAAKLARRRRRHS